MIFAIILKVKKSTGGNTTPIVSDIAVDGPLTDAVGYGATGGLIVGSAITNGLVFDSRNGAVVIGNDLGSGLAKVVAFVDVIIEALSLVLVNNHLSTIFYAIVVTSVRPILEIL